MYLNHVFYRVYSNNFFYAGCIWIIYSIGCTRNMNYTGCVRIRFSTACGELRTLNCKYENLVKLFLSILTSKKTKRRKDFYKFYLLASMLAILDQVSLAGSKTSTVLTRRLPLNPPTAYTRPLDRDMDWLKRNVRNMKKKIWIKLKKTLT